MSETDATVDRKAQKTAEYDGPSGGWGSLKAIARIFAKEWDTPAALDTLRRQNKPKGFMCVSCSWAKPADYHAFEFCENGAKATLWELTTRRCTPDFFANHVSELRNWSDYDPEQQGRLTQPLRYDPTSDHYVRCEWEEAFSAIGSSYYPEMNPLIALSHHDEQSKTPAAKSVQVRIRA
jgi:anaerobic selenocysteine-containing dehydrogenase